MGIEILTNSNQPFDTVELASEKTALICQALRTVEGSVKYAEEVKQARLDLTVTLGQEAQELRKIIIRDSTGGINN